MTTEWRSVPVNLTDAMVDQAYPYCTDDAVGCWDDILAAAPRASEDEALVDRLTGVAWRELFIMLRASKAANIGSEHARFLTLSILVALETPHD